MKTKKLLCAFLLLTLIPFFVMVSVFLNSPGQKGNAVSKNNLYFTVSATDGVIEDNVDYVPFNVPATGNYQVEIDYVTNEPGFYTALVMKDAENKAVFYFGAFSITGFMNQVDLPEGRATLEIHYITTEQELRDFCAIYPILKENEIDDFIPNLHFEEFTKSGSWSPHLDMNVYEMIMPSETMVYVTVALGVVLLILLLVVFSKDHQTEEADEKTSVSGIGIRYSVFLFSVIIFQYLFSLGLRLFVPTEVIAQNVVTLSLILTILAFDVVGVAVIFLTTKNMPANPPEKHPFGIGKYFLFLLMTAGLMGFGALIGGFVNGRLSSNQTSDLENLMLNSGLLLRVLAVGILAPIFEELIFRKLMIDRLLKHGEFVAILISGLTFGLFHGNFQQFFFATFIGMLWAFIYVRTGNVKNTIALHMTVNLSTSVVTILLAQKFMDYNPTGSSDPEFLTQLLTESPMAMLYVMLFGLWIMLIITFAVAGFIVFLVFFLKKKFRLKRLENEPTKARTLALIFSSAYFWLYLLVGLGPFITNYLPGLLN